MSTKKIKEKKEKKRSPHFQTKAKPKSQKKKGEKKKKKKRKKERRKPTHVSNRKKKSKKKKKKKKNKSTYWRLEVNFKGIFRSSFHEFSLFNFLFILERKLFDRLGEKTPKLYLLFSFLISDRLDKYIP